MGGSAPPQKWEEHYPEGHGWVDGRRWCWRQLWCGGIEWFVYRSREGGYRLKGMGIQRGGTGIVGFVFCFGVRKGR